MSIRRRLIPAAFFTACLLILLSQCARKRPADIRGEAYTGSQTCVSCHKDVAGLYAHDVHRVTSRFLATALSSDSLQLPAGEFLFTGQTRVGVEKRANGLYQVAYVNGKNMKEERTDLAFGAGRSAYTFAFWYGDQLMQMPLNYHVKEHQWVNSPGFPDNQIYFGRPIVARCLECHASFAIKKPLTLENMNAPEEFERNSVIAGIDCERCHGPGAQHAGWQADHPDEKKSRYMTAYRDLSRDQKVNTCGICHSGAELQTAVSPFYFKPGDTINNLPDYNKFLGKDPDVHGNQKQLMQSSQCYIKSDLTCTSCHAPHAATKPDMVAYNQVCRNCHQAAEKQHTGLSGESMIAGKCVDCHMPVMQSDAIGFQKSNSKDKIPYSIRTHRIAVYPPTAKKAR
ncbi:MAG: hypothetical protein INR69_11910 [Mucilaginibacter polytrichastri]|nr:hypothetical protein [Mucilaginibacter polytrichastri]